MALALRLDKSKARVYAIVGDGEIQEGQIWEAAMSAAHYKLDNLVCFIDHNGLQIDGSNEQVMDLGDVCAKYAAFGWEVCSVDGHDVAAITAAIQAPRCGKPRFICCNTVKGKGVSFMENQVGWHGKPMNQEQYEAARRELEV
jgi:transketolase